MLIKSRLFSIMGLYFIDQRVIIFTSLVFQNARKEKHPGVHLEFVFMEFFNLERVLPDDLAKSRCHEMFIFFPHPKVIIILLSAILFTDSTRTRLTRCFKEREGVKNTLKSNQ